MHTEYKNMTSEMRNHSVSQMVAGLKDPNNGAVYLELAKEIILSNIII